MRNVVAGASAIDLKRGLDRGLKAAVAALRALSRPVGTRKEKAQVATISAHNDPTIGELVADAMEKVGSEGVITVEESKTTETTLEVVEGMQFDRGFLSPYFVTDPEKMEAVLEDPVILLTDRKIGALKDLLPLLEQVAKSGRPLLVVAEDVEGEALATLIVNQLRGSAEVLRGQGARLRRPPQGDAAGHRRPDRRPVVAEELGLKLENVRLEQLGRAKRVVVDKDNTTIIGGAGDTRGDRRARRADPPRDREDDQRLRPREAAGAAGEAGRRRRRDPRRRARRGRDEGARRRRSTTRSAPPRRRSPRASCRAAAWPCCAASRRSRSEEAQCEGDERTGRADPQARARGADAPDRRELRGRRRRRGRADAARARAIVGFDAARKKYVDLVEAGIIDPTKVVRIALENAVSVASVLLLTEATMTEIPEEKPERATEPEMAL